MRDNNNDRARALDSVRRTYERYAQEGRSRLWDTANPGYARMALDRDTALVDLIGKSVPAGGTLLDVGCGHGDLAEEARSVGLDLGWTGIDLLEDVIAAARRHYPWAEWLVGSADRLPFGDASFDVVVASTLFSSLPTMQLERDVASEVSRVLRPGGWLVWYDLRVWNPANRSVHGVSRRRLSRLFPGWSMETRSMTLLPPVARRAGRLTALAYPALETIPWLRSHMVGRLRRPDALRPSGATSRHDERR